MADLAAVISAVLHDASAQIQSKADVNKDSATTAADVLSVAAAVGKPCAGGSPTRSVSGTVTTPRSTPTPTGPTGTATRTRSQTATPTKTATATPTMVCPAQPIVLGPTPASIDGELTAQSCQRRINRQDRPVDVYNVAGTPGMAIQIAVAAPPGPSPIVPYIVLSDADGQFGFAQGPAPLEFFVTTTRPYEFMVTSSSNTNSLGPYTVTVTQVPCPTPVALTFSNVRPSPVSGTLDLTDCPDPGAPSSGTALNPADVYTFTVNQVPANVSITMQQVSTAEDIYATLSLRGPTGGEWYNRLEVVSSDLVTDCSSLTASNPPSCAQIRFLALQPGTYTIIATGSGGLGRYTLTLAQPTCPATALNNIPADGPLLCTQPNAGCSCSSQPGAPTSACGGRFTLQTACAAPLAIPNISDGEPEDVASPADRYTFTAVAGDVISVVMSTYSDSGIDDAHLYLLGPAPDNALIAQDDNSGGNDSVATDLGPYDAELAATLPQSGVYTIIAANNVGLDPEDPTTPVTYTLYVQKCPAMAFGMSQTQTQSFTPSDCIGYGGIPFRSFAVNGNEGQFLSASVSSDDVDAFVRILGPDGSRTENDTDPFTTATTDARASRILQESGTYFVEVSSNIDAGSVDTTTSPLPQFTLRTSTCGTIAASAGAINGTFGGSSCTLTSGQKFNVYTFTPPVVPKVASVQPPSNGCVLNLLAEGPQTPDAGCSPAVADMPLMSTGHYGFIIAAANAATTGPYTGQLSICPLASATFGDVINGSLSAGDCAGADGARADWFLINGAADLVQFNAPFSGFISASFPFRATLTDVLGASSVTGLFFDDPTPPDPLFQYPLPPATTPPPPFGGELAFLLRILGATPSDGGQYTLKVDPAFYPLYGR